ncbi:hypothetical protein [Peribacillus alkalitolerans]|uniref:hypothetical protein n=1 Tax=Peribacillus alkalitolerans TaxID=1550385 RepID=UPI001F085372|nr:hypothetical protein [Peribacillus alkalitolerans]
MINDIKYQHHFPDAMDEAVSPTIVKGKELGSVTYKMADNACSNHRMKNGDAAYLEKGTKVYEIIGYPTSLIVSANEKVYVVDQNKKAKTVGDLYPMADLVKNIHIESTEDGSRLYTFSSSSKDTFLEEWQDLKLEDQDRLNKRGAFEGERVFLEIELNNGISFRELYWSDTNTFNLGAKGNSVIKEIIHTELSKISNQ